MISLNSTDNCGFFMYSPHARKFIRAWLTIITTHEHFVGCYSKAFTFIIKGHICFRPETLKMGNLFQTMNVPLLHPLNTTDQCYFITHWISSMALLNSLFLTHSSDRLDICRRFDAGENIAHEWSA